MRQIAEKAIEFNHTAYLCFVELTKAFDRVRLANVIEFLRESEVPVQVVWIILKNGVIQGDSLSPMLFNLIMEKIIANMPEELGYRMGNAPIHIMCYADDAVLLADSKEQLQNVLFRFDQMAESLNMEISLNKTNSLTISRNYTKCEVQLRATPIEQVP